MNEKIKSFFIFLKLILGIFFLGIVYYYSNASIAELLLIFVVSCIALDVIDTSCFYKQHSRLREIFKYLIGKNEYLKNLFYKNNQLTYLNTINNLDFAIYFDAPSKASNFHLSMWVPYLQQLNRPFAVIVRKLSIFNMLNRKHIPVIFAKNITDLDAVILTMNVKTIFYVNNGMRNTHCLRFNNITHVQLLHGDSDKPSNFNPISNLYDFLLVPGELAIDRYRNNNVYIRKDKFRIISRPQGSHIEVTKKTQPSPIKTILYAPTWRGNFTDCLLSSINIAEKLVLALINDDYRVIFRPHPYSYQETQHNRIISKIAKILLRENKKTTKQHCIANDKRFNYLYARVDQCINEADVMITDVTSLVADWLFSAKPYAIIDVFSNKKKFMADNPLAHGGYYLDLSLKNLEKILKDIKTKDSLRIKRLNIRQYGLGLTLGESAVDKFIHTTNHILDKFNKLDHQQQLIQKHYIGDL